MNFKQVLQGVVMAMAIAFATTASAQIDLPPEDPPTGELRLYFVSAVLKKNGTDGVIKLIHSIRTAVSARASAAHVEASVQRDFPEYSMASMLVTRGYDLKLPPCAAMNRGSDAMDKVQPAPAKDVQFQAQFI